MIPMTRRLTAATSLLTISLISTLGGCGPDSFTPSGTGGVVGSGGVGTGGAVTGAGGSVGSGGVGSGGVASGGTTAGSGGAAAGGVTGHSGGASSGGSESGTGGAVEGTGGTVSAGPTLHVFMLMGQSNMAGVAPRQASDNNTDERLKVWGGCNYPQNQWNTVVQPPLSSCPGETGINPSNSVDPGIVFGKAMLASLPDGDTIGLVGTAESGESINTFISGGSHHQMILNKIAGAKATENARFAGVIFHQGESDTGQASWPGKVVQLYSEVKEAWGVDYEVPFILGELPAGGCCSSHNTRIHEAAEALPIGDYVSQQGTNVMDQYHFDHASVILMGERYAEKMIPLLGW